MPGLVSPLTRAIDAELAFRELARRRLFHFLRYRFHAEKRPLSSNWHLQLLCELLEAQTSFQLRNLMVNMPPRFLKSETASQCWHAWMIGRDDSSDSTMVSASYAAALAARDSAKTLAILGTAWYQALFPGVEIAKATEVEWATVKGSGRIAAGALGAITGKGGMRLLADDLLKPLDANSETVREKTNNWLGEVFLSRRNDPKRATITVIAQRLHERDPCGYLLEDAKRSGAASWHHVNLSLENVDAKPKVYSYGGFRYLRKAGELLHPDRIDAVEIAKMKSLMRVNFEGQYNQRPQKMEGGMLRPALLVKLDKPPERMARDLGLRPNIYIDLATKEKQTQKDDPDFSVLVVMARDQLQRKIILDMWRAQASMDTVARALLALHDKWKKLGMPVRFVKGEKIGLQHAFRSVMTTTCRLLHRGILPLHDMSVSADITQRVMPFESALNANQLVVPSGATWLPDFEAEMRAFPRGAHDDAIVASSYGCNDLEESPAGEAPAHHPDIPDDMVTGDMLERARKRADLIRQGQDADEA